jgi:DNA/RNA endonuclease G (NUC1)
MFAFMVLNIDKPTGTISTYTVSVNQVEKFTGLDFFGALPAEEQDRLQRTANTLPVQ